MGLSLRLKTCCFGCSLEVGTKILAWVEGIGTLIMFLITLYGIIFYDPKPVGSDGQYGISWGLFKVYLIFCFIGLSIVLLIDLLLLKGLYQKKHFYVRLYVTFNALLLMIVSISWLLFFCEPTHFEFTMILMAVVALRVYFLLVINSFYHNMPGVLGENHH